MRFSRPSAFAVLVAALLAAPSTARADDPIESDRPDITDGPRTLAVGRWQLEAGVTRSDQGGETDLAAGEGLLRYGLAQGFELRLALPTWNRLGSGPTSVRGLGDAGAGFKWTLPGAGEGQALGVVADVTAPTGARGIGGGEAGGDLALAFAHALGSEFGISANLGAERAEGGTALLVSTSIETDLGRGWGTWTEWAASATRHATAHLFDAGFTYAIARDVRLDVRTAVGAGAAKGEGQFGAGVTTRW